MSELVLTNEQKGREQSFLVAIVLDIAIVVAMVIVAIVGGSFTLLAETLRCILGLLPEWFAFGVLRRIHRGVLVDLDYGTGKLEQVASLAIGAAMLLASAWIVAGSLKILSGERELGTPMGLAAAAVVGMINLYLNVVAWDGVRRLPGVRDSTIMNAQLTLRWTKLLASIIISVDLTIAALSTDPVIVAVADAVGSLLVACYMALIAIQALRGSLPDLLDFSAGQSIKDAVDRSLALHAADYSQLQRVRTRRSSHTAFVEIALKFEPGLSMAEVDRRVAALKATMRQEVGEAEVSVLASAAPR
ncbi:MAG TPA: cation transporter [Vicinamibacterales bacterium]|nr:cation transporter [Vicinamibacterales bacterium]